MQQKCSYGEYRRCDLPFQKMHIVAERTDGVVRAGWIEHNKSKADKYNDYSQEAVIKIKPLFPEYFTPFFIISHIEKPGLRVIARDQLWTTTGVPVSEFL